MGLQFAPPRIQPVKALIEAEINHRLTHSAYAELRGVRCHWHDGILTLHGCVSSYYLKQRAQAEVQRLDSVERIINQLDVICPAVASDAQLA